MDWQAIWGWLSDPVNQTTLGVIGGGVSAVAIAIFAVVKLLLGRKEKGGPSGQVTADRGGVAAGRDAIVSRGDPPAKPK